MKNIRAGVRLLGFVMLLIITFCVFFAGLLFCFPKRKWSIRWKNRVISYWAVATAKLIGLRMHIRGTPPDPPFFLVSNHLSYIDILPFWSYLQTTFIAKSEIQNWPVIGRTARLLGIIFIDRDKNRDLKRVNQLIEKNICRDQGVILFPEGTSSKGKRVLPFKSSLLFYPARHETPVHYASISYKVTSNDEHNAWKELCWWGEMDFVSHFWNLLKIKSFATTVRFGEKPVNMENRKKLGVMLKHKVEENFTPTFPH